MIQVFEDRWHYRLLDWRNCYYLEGKTRNSLNTKPKCLAQMERNQHGQNSGPCCKEKVINLCIAQLPPQCGLENIALQYLNITMLNEL